MSTFPLFLSRRIRRTRPFFHTSTMHPAGESRDPRPLIAVFETRSLDTGDIPLDELADLGRVIFRDGKISAETCRQEAEALIVVINKSPISTAVLARFPQLRMIAVTATGYDCVDLDAARQAGVLVCHVPEYGTEAVAEHVFALLLAHCRAVERHDALIRAGQWQRHGEFSFWETPQTEIAGLTLGIVGWGRIGRRVATIAQAWGMHILVHTRQPPGNSPAAVRFLDLATLVAEADIVSLHCPLNDATRGMVNDELLSRMKSTAILINTARGGLVDEQRFGRRIAGGASRRSLVGHGCSRTHNQRQSAIFGAALHLDAAPGLGHEHGTSAAGRRDSREYSSVPGWESAPPCGITSRVHSATTPLEPLLSHAVARIGSLVACHLPRVPFPHEFDFEE